MTGKVTKVLSSEVSTRIADKVSVKSQRKSVTKATAPKKVQKDTDLGNMPQKADLVPKKVSEMHCSVNLSSKDEAINISEQIEHKIKKYLKFVPVGAKLKTPVKIEIDGHQYEMALDRTNDYVSVVKLCETDEKYPTILNIELDKDGKMVKGNLFVRKELSASYEFIRDKNNARRINYVERFHRRIDKKMTFAPVGGTNNWNLLKQPYLDKDVNPVSHMFGGIMLKPDRNQFPFDPLCHLFFSLTDLYKTII